MFVNNQNSTLHIPNDFVIYHQTSGFDETKHQVKYIFIPEDHENVAAIIKAAEFISDNYQEGDIVVAENFLAGTEVQQGECRSTKAITKKIKVIGWDIEEMCFNEEDYKNGKVHFKEGTISERANQKALELQKQFREISEIIRKCRIDILTILADNSVNEIFNLCLESLKKISIDQQSELTTAIAHDRISVLIKELSPLEEIDFFNEKAVGDFFEELSSLINETEEIKRELEILSKEEKLENQELLSTFYKNVQLLISSNSALIEIQKRSDRLLFRKESAINSSRIIETFQARTLSMMQVLDKIALSAQRVFLLGRTDVRPQHVYVFGGFNHFIEGIDAKNHPKMRLESFNAWMSDKSCLVVGPKI